MDSSEFRRVGKEMVDYIADYLDNIKNRRVTPEIEPGYLQNLIPNEAPLVGESWKTIMDDVESKIMPGITHWQHPRFHAYFPAGNAYPSILGDMLSSGLGIVGFSWAASPACTELETIVLDWLGKMCGLPKNLLPFESPTMAKFDENMNSPLVKNAVNSTSEGYFSTSEESTTNADTSSYTPHTGGGVILTTASECVLVAMLSARRRAINKFKRHVCYEDDGVILNKLVAYSSKLAHSCVEKAAMISLVKMRQLDVDENQALRGETLANAMKEDREQGLIPFFVCCTFGTTSCCSFDSLVECGPVCQTNDVYLHVDAAYAGSMLICEELRSSMGGLEYADSINSCQNKWMLVNFDCSCLWVRDKYAVTQALSVDPIYLQYSQQDKTIDYRHWGIALSRRFRALKLWFTLRSYGVKGLQDYIREHIRLARFFEALVRSDERFEIVGTVSTGLVCFRLRGNDNLSKSLLYLLNDSGSIHMTPAIWNERYMIRFCVNAEKACEEDMSAAWEIIRNAAETIFSNYSSKASILDLCAQTDKFVVEIDSLIDMSKMRRKCFTRMVSDPVRPAVRKESFCGTQHSLPQPPVNKKKILRYQTLQCSTDEIKEVEDY